MKGHKIPSIGLIKFAREWPTTQKGPWILRQTSIHLWVLLEHGDSETSNQSSWSTCLPWAGQGGHQFVELDICYWNYFLESLIIDVESPGPILFLYKYNWAPTWWWTWLGVPFCRNTWFFHLIYSFSRREWSCIGPFDRGAPRLRSNAWPNSIKVCMCVRRICLCILPWPYLPTYAKWRNPSPSPWMCTWSSPYFERK